MSDIKTLLLITFIVQSVFSPAQAQDMFTHSLNFESSQPYTLWKTGPWSACDRPCGTNIIQSRTVACIDNDGNTLNPDRCSHTTRPATNRACKDQPPCTWEQACTDNIGNGQCTYTSPICMSYDSRIISNYTCSITESGAGTPLPTPSACTGSCPPPPQWRTSAGRCSECVYDGCGGASTPPWCRTVTFTVTCTSSTGATLPDSACSGTPPVSSRPTANIDEQYQFYCRDRC